MCDPRLTHDLAKAGQDSPHSHKMDILAHAIWFGLTRMCWDHIRILGRVTLGLYSNGLTHDLLKDRISSSYAARDDLLSFIQSHRNWFNKGARLSHPSDLLIPYRYPPAPVRPFSFDPEVLFRRYAGPDAYARWLEDGNILLPHFCSYLDQPDINRFIDQEFDLYRFHFREPLGTPSMGFLRNMFYSLIQQALRQDPAFYSILVAARPDKCSTLTTYPLRRQGRRVRRQDRLSAYGYKHR